MISNFPILKTRIGLRKPTVYLKKILKRQGTPSPQQLEAYQKWKKNHLTTLFRPISVSNSFTSPLLRYRLNPQTQELEDVEAKTADYDRKMQRFEQFIKNRDGNVFRFYRIYDLFNVLSNQHPHRSEVLHL